MLPHGVIRDTVEPAQIKLPAAINHATPPFITVRAISPDSERGPQSFPFRRPDTPPYHGDNREASALRPKLKRSFCSAANPLTYGVAYDLFRLIEIAQPNVDLFLGFLFGDAIFLLDLANETVEFTGDYVNVIFRESPPLLLDFTL